MKEKVQDGNTICGGKDDVIFNVGTGAILMVYCSLKRQSPWNRELCTVPINSRRRRRRRFHLTFLVLEPRHQSLKEAMAEGRTVKARLVKC